MDSMADDQAFVDEQIRLLQTPFAVTDIPMWEGESNYPPVSDAALGATIRRMNTLLRKDVLRFMGPAARRSLLAQLAALQRERQNPRAKRADDFFAEFPTQWPDHEGTSGEQRREYETKRSQVFALTQAIGDLRERLLHRQQLADRLTMLRLMLQTESTTGPLRAQAEQTRNLVDQLTTQTDKGNMPKRKAGVTAASMLPATAKRRKLSGRELANNQ